MFLPPYDEVSRILALLSSALITIGSYDQVWRIWKRRSVADISPLYILFAGFNEVTWLNYGIAIHEWPIILVGIVNFPPCILAVWGCLKFRDPKPKTPPQYLESLTEKPVV
ncbi:hypothetical protein EON83_22590 [bacterium]|nr:MAG: hypothetical protein EON83_22590 [bacterium]